MFAAVSENGEIFTFVPTDANGGGGGGSGGDGKERERDKVATVRPQRVWALRKQWSAVRVRSTFHHALTPFVILVRITRTLMLVNSVV